MFTGLVEATGTVHSLSLVGESARLTLNTDALTSQLSLGDSVAVNGCCLTVAELDVSQGRTHFDLLMQTLKVTNLGDLKPGKKVNLERAMALGTRFGGHLVQGHVDATVCILDWSMQGQDYRLEVEYPHEFQGLVIPKGSICLDGISLTAAEVRPKSIVCWIIPHTREVTHLLEKQAGDRLNVEYDLLGKYVRELVKANAA